MANTGLPHGPALLGTFLEKNVRLYSVDAPAAWRCLPQPLMTGSTVVAAGSCPVTTDVGSTNSRADWLRTVCRHSLGVGGLGDRPPDQVACNDGVPAGLGLPVRATKPRRPVPR